MPPTSHGGISVTMVVRNEADRLPAALASVAWCDDVVVLDGDSTDGTTDLARAAGARVVQEPWRGFGPQKNRAAELARHDWILNLDADERVDAALAAALRADPAGRPLPAYRVRRRNHCAGRPLAHWPWAWDTQVRLYDRRRARFSDAQVHESVQAGAVGELPGVLEHLTYRDWADARARQERYAALWAEQARAAGRRAGAMAAVARPPIAFLQAWLLRGYLRSGAEGWRWAALAAHYTRRKYALLRQQGGGRGEEGGGASVKQGPVHDPGTGEAPP